VCFPHFPSFDKYLFTPFFFSFSERRLVSKGADHNPRQAAARVHASAQVQPCPRPPTAGEEVQAGRVDVSTMNGTKFAWSLYVFVFFLLAKKKS
jgi:hypothetical protein